MLRIGGRGSCAVHAWIVHVCDARGPCTWSAHGRLTGSARGQVHVDSARAEVEVMGRYWGDGGQRQRGGVRSGGVEQGEGRRGKGRGLLSLKGKGYAGCGARRKRHE